MKPGDLVKSGKIRGVYAHDGVQSGTGIQGIVIREPNGRETWVLRRSVVLDTQAHRVFVLTRLGREVLRTMEEVASTSAMIERKDRILLAILEAAEAEACKTQQSREAAVEAIVDLLFAYNYVGEEVTFPEVMEALQACVAERLVGYIIE